MDEWLRKCASTAGGTSWSLFRELRTHSNVVQSKKDKFGLASLVGSTHHHRVVWGKWGKRWKVVSVAPSGCGWLWPPVPFPCASSLCSCPVCLLERCTYAPESIHSPESRVAVCQYQKTNCLSYCCLLSSSQKLFFPFFRSVESTLPCLWDFSSPSRIKPVSMALNPSPDLWTARELPHPRNCKGTIFFSLIGGEHRLQKKWNSFPEISQLASCRVNMAPASMFLSMTGPSPVMNFLPPRTCWRRGHCLVVKQIWFSMKSMLSTPDIH